MSEHIKGNDAELEAIRAEWAADGWTLLEGEEVEEVRRFIRQVYVQGDKFAFTRIVQESFAPKHRSLVVECVSHAGQGFALAICGWEPLARLTVAELQQAFTGIYESDPEQDGAINALEDRSSRKSLLTDPKACMEIARDLRNEMVDRAVTCRHYLDKLERLRNWRGEIPNHALVFRMPWKPEQTIEFLKAWKPEAE